VACRKGRVVPQAFEPDRSADRRSPPQARRVPPRLPIAQCRRRL
jgi:hypothetical protein